MIISWYGCRVGSTESAVGIVIGFDIARTVPTGEEQGEEAEKELGAVACRGRIWQQKRWHICTCSTLVSFHGPLTGSSGPFWAVSFRLVITQPTAPKKRVFGYQFMLVGFVLT